MHAHTHKLEAHTLRRISDIGHKHTYIRIYIYIYIFKLEVHTLRELSDVGLQHTCIMTPLRSNIHAFKCMYTYLELEAHTLRRVSNVGPGHTCIMTLFRGRCKEISWCRDPHWPQRVLISAEYVCMFVFMYVYACVCVWAFLVL